MSADSPNLPPQYQTGLAPFRYLELKVTPDVLIPRPETEGLVDLAITKVCELVALKELHQDCEPLRILEIGTGSGAIILALASELPKQHQISDCLFVATDISEAALQVARESADKLHLTSEICFLQDDLAITLCSDDEFKDYFDIVISNPPYVPTAELLNLPPMVKDYEPMLALDGGADGLVIWRRIVQQSTTLLKTGGWLLGELHESKVGVAASEIASDFCWTKVEVKDDLTQRPRYLSTQKQVTLSALAEQLQAGQIGILPTDTVYGLVMVADEAADLKRFAEIKERSVKQPLVLLLAKADDYLDYVAPEANYEYLQAFTKQKWPGATTLIVRASDYAQNKYGKFISTEENIALRVPDNPTLQALIELLNCPLASSSANQHDLPTPQSFADISPELLELVDFAYQSTSDGSGQASEIIDCSAPEPRVIRASN